MSTGRGETGTKCGAPDQPERAVTGKSGNLRETQTRPGTPKREERPCRGTTFLASWLESSTD